MFLLCGLGNKGGGYFYTRHNIGFLVIDRFSEKYAIPLDRKTCSCKVGIKEGLVIAKPNSYMNLSGQPVSSLIKKFGIELEKLVVIHDDLDMDFGRIKIRWDGKDGGHKGVRSVIESLQSKGFYRLKIGIGRDPTMTPEDFVLSMFREDERQTLDETLDIAAEALHTFIYDSKEKAMSIYNRR